MYRNTGKNSYSLVFQEVKGLMKKCISLMCTAMISFKFIVNGFSYNAFYSSIIMYRKREIIINTSKSKGINENILCLCTSCHDNIPACAVSRSLALPLLNFISST